MKLTVNQWNQARIGVMSSLQFMKETSVGCISHSHSIILTFYEYDMVEGVKCGT